MEENDNEETDEEVIPHEVVRKVQEIKNEKLRNLAKLSDNGGTCLKKWEIDSLHRAPVNILCWFKVGARWATILVPYGNLQKSQGCPCWTTTLHPYGPPKVYQC